MSSTLPQLGRRFRLSRVICFQTPSGPAQTSGGCEYDCRITADCFWSLERESERSPHPSAPMVSAPLHRVVTLPPARSSVATATEPSRFSENKTLCADDHVSQFGEALMPGVTS